LFLFTGTLFASNSISTKDGMDYTYNIVALTPNSYRINVLNSSGTVCLSQIIPSAVKPSVDLFDNGLLLIATSNGLSVYSVKKPELVSAYTVNGDVSYVDSISIIDINQDTISVVYFSDNSDPSYKVAYSVDKSSGKIIKETSVPSDEVAYNILVRIVSGFIRGLFVSLPILCILGVIKYARDEIRWE